MNAEVSILAELNRRYAEGKKIDLNQHWSVLSENAKRQDRLYLMMCKLQDARGDDER